MKTLIAVVALMPTTALAHAGHLADAAGHDHWVAGAALAAAAAIVVWGALKGKTADKAEADDVADDAEPKEA